MVTKWSPKHDNLLFSAKLTNVLTIPLSEAIAAKLTGLNTEEVRPHILHNKTHQAYINLINRNADIIFVTSPSSEETALAKEKGVALEVTPIVSEAFVFLTHIDNPVTGLTFEGDKKYLCR